MAPRRPRRSDKIRRFRITPRETRDLEARFTRDVQELRRVTGVSRTGSPIRHPKETIDQWGARVFDAFEELLHRYRPLFSGMRGGRSGRPKKIRSIPRVNGRPSNPLAVHVVGLIANGDQRPLRTLAREVIAEHLRRRDPRLHEALIRARERFESEEGCKREKALQHAFNAPSFKPEREAIRNLIRSVRYHLRARNDSR